ncbi:isoamyl alcohol oxidase protein [Rutstroemia sp. NJR-2017a BVV2]|nr:isoamyl alcohol oxidase protein [Rutstroemia sp. NJR-2017a BVV2]
MRIPSAPCWPTAAQWSTFNNTISGKLVRNVPIAAPCYPGVYEDATKCAAVTGNWTDTSFRSSFPIGYAYPYTESCDLPGGNTTLCSLGDSPVFAVNATTSADVIAGLKFAREKNLRLVVKMTGHDLLGRSTGYGSLEIWLRYLRQGVNFEKTYITTPSYNQRTTPLWTGSAIEVNGGYSWSDVYKVAVANKVIVVGGGCPDVGAIGGYMQGGGHSPASRDFGLGADQLLEAQVVLTNGQKVLASPNENSDLFRALRGGGGGTYGIVTSAKIKAYPDSKYTSQAFYMAPLNASGDALAAFMEAVALIYAAFPTLNDGGLSGYGTWTSYSIPNTLNASLTYSLGAKGKTIQQVEALFQPTLEKLLVYNGTALNIAVSYATYGSYWDYYFSTSGVNSAASANSALVSRLFTKDNLSKGAALRKMLNTTAGTAYEGTVNGFCLVSGGAVFNSSDPFSGVNPVWRKSYAYQYTARGWLDTADYSTAAAVHHDITYGKGGALREFAPDTGVYMSESDWQDPYYLQDFYGSQLPVLQAAKSKYDPESVLYCPTCVGSEEWAVTSNGSLCKV